MLLFSLKRIRFMTSDSPLTQADMWSKAVLNIIFMQKKITKTVSNTGTAVMRA